MGAADVTEPEDGATADVNEPDNGATDEETTEDETIISHDELERDG